MVVRFEESAEQLPILGHEGEIDRELMEEFMRLLPEFCSEIEAAYLQGDLDILTHKVHHLYGGVCFLNTPRLLSVAEKWEVYLRGKHCKDQLEVIYQDFLRSVEELKSAYAAL